MPTGGGGSSQTVSQQELAPEQRQLLSLIMPDIESYIAQDLQLPTQRVNYGRTGQERRAQEQLRRGAGDVGRLGQNSIATAKGLMGTGGQGAVMSLGELLQGGRGMMSDARGIISGGRDLFNTGGELYNRGGGLIQGGYGLVNAGRGLQGEVQPGTNQSLGQLLQGRMAGPAGGAERRLLSGEFMDPNSQLLRQQSRAAIRPVQQALTRQVLPGIRSGSIGNNMFGSSRGEIAEGLALSDFSKQALDATTALQANNFDRGLAAMSGAVSDAGSRQLGATGVGSDILGLALGARGAGLNAAQGGLGVQRSALDAQRSGLDAQRSGFDVRRLGLDAIGQAGSGFSNLALQSLLASPQLSQLALTPGLVSGAITGQNRSIEQAKRAEQNERFSTRQILPFLQAQDVAQLAFGMGGGSATTSSSQKPGFDPLGTAIGGGTMLGLLAMGGLLPFSDRRLKMNITPMFKLGPHQWYSYEFIHQPGQKRLGVMAQEVFEIQPEAVFFTEYGYLGVHYALLNVDMKGDSNVSTHA